MKFLAVARGDGHDEDVMRRARRLQSWDAMTPEQRDYDRTVARQIPYGASWIVESSAGRLANLHAWESSIDDGCSCMVSAPCSYCTRDTDDAA